MSTELAVKSEQPFVNAQTLLSTHLGIEPKVMIDTIKAQCFKGKRPDEVTDAQLAAFISVCNTMDLNPLVQGMVYAYPERNGGICAILGPDGTMKKIDEFISAGKLDGYECEVYPEDMSKPPTHATATIWRKGSDKPAKYTASFKEWNVSSNPNWNSRPRHMLWIRALKQAARQVIHGLPFDDDEYKIAQMQNVTPEGAEGETTPVPERPKVERAKRGAAKAMENADKGATGGEPATGTTERAKDLANAKANAVEGEVVHEKPKAPEPQAVVTKLADKEVRTFENCSVEEFTAKNFGTTERPKPAVKGILKGSFEGTVYDMNATLLGEAVSYTDAWQLEKPVRITLKGAARTDGSVGILVESIEIMEAPVNDANEVPA